MGIDPNNIYALYNKGLALDNLGRYKEAISYYDKVLDIDPNDVDTLNNKIAALGKLTPGFTPTSFSSNAYGRSQGYTYVSNSLNETSTTVTISADAATCENNQKLVERGLKLQPDNIMILTNAGINLMYLIPS